MSIARSTALCAALCLGASMGAATGPAAAQGIETQFLISHIDSITPKCRDHPDAPVVGRVSGIVSGTPSRGVSFVGCFASMEACEAWRMPVSGRISGRIIQNRCSYRH
ncbi:hypothetical protein [Acuticoccus mangrovi]|uniref:Subtilisin inhibitor domain-containing protein n=1 Tax=Acuticoccus mangrovi TaxID=2796142 RepID=A0A934IM81_9HYPH|nr:hypothetical protein [Acuticoccus mangrovi]MBJ3774480.1 hypothetical protein [Acuticoccus mangrovi]